MKKLFLMVAAVAALAFVGCSKDENKVDLTTSLDGTVWEATEDYGGGDSATYRLEFSNKSFQWTMIWIEDGEKETDKLSGNYRYDYPEVIMTIDGESVRGVISENSMSLYDEEGYLVTLKRKK